MASRLCAPCWDTEFNLVQPASWWLILLLRRLLPLWFSAFSLSIVEPACLERWLIALGKCPFPERHACTQRWGKADELLPCCMMKVLINVTLKSRKVPLLCSCHSWRLARYLEGLGSCLVKGRELFHFCFWSMWNLKRQKSIITPISSTFTVLWKKNWGFKLQIQTAKCSNLF